MVDYRCHVVCLLIYVFVVCLFASLFVCFCFVCFVCLLVVDYRCHQSCLTLLFLLVATVGCYCLLLIVDFIVGC